MKRSGFQRKATTPLKRTPLAQKSLTRRAVVDSKGVKTLTRGKVAKKVKSLAICTK